MGFNQEIFRKFFNYLYQETQHQEDETSLLEKNQQYNKFPFPLHIFDSIASTNQTLWDLLALAAKTGTVVIATHQTAGRGQWGRNWLSKDGGLYLSTAIFDNSQQSKTSTPLPLRAKDSYQLTLATAWGIANQLRSIGVPVGIKWPNDLLLNGCKLGGILTETKVHREEITQAIVGVGVNWTNPVPDTGINLQNWQDISGTKQISCLEMLAAVVVLGINSGIECLFQEGVNTLLSRYLDLLINMGERISINNMLGTIVGVTESGELRVSMDIDNTSVNRTQEICLHPGTISLGYNRKFSD